jgi:DNA-binding PadR family transcriptional regulator
MTTRRADLGELETLVMLAVLRLRREASVQRIREEIAEKGGRELSRGALYATLSRLERKGLLDLTERQPSEGGRARHHFELSREGLATLQTAQRHLSRMRAGLESILEGSS